MKLGAKLRLSYVGIVLVAVSIVLLLIIDNARRELKEKIGRDLQVAARLEADNIDSYIDETITRARFYSKAPALKAGDTTAINAYLKERKTAEPAFGEISLLNTAGKTIASTDPRYIGNPFLLHETGSADLFNKVKQAPEESIFFKFGYADKEKTEIVGLVFMPLTDERTKEVSSVLVASVRMDHILKPIDKFNIQTVGGDPAYEVEHASKMIMTQDGKSKTFTPLVYLQPASPLRAYLAGVKDGYVTFSDPEKGALIAGYADLREHGTKPGEDWAVISMAPQKEVFSPAIRLRNKMIVLGVIAVIIAWIISLFLARGISRPIIKLAEVSRKIAQGDLSQRADIMSKDEVGDLARAFNKMTDELDSAIAARDQEIIERKNIEEKLKEEMENKANFISMIAYEFRPSMTSIREGIGMVLKEAAGKITEKQKELLELAKRSSGNLSRLVNDIIEFHHLETERAEFKMEENDINEVVADVGNSMAPLLAAKKKVEYIVNVDDTLPKARFDREKITLVLTNIVNIAVKSTEEGRVTVTTAKEGDNAVRVSVKDSGPGVNEEDLPKLFNRYETTGKKKDKAAGGTGLGLTISREIIDKHRGRIWAESEPGKGTTIIFVLPVTERRKN
ncbi:MAG: sensor histidine kinase [Candidatus Omnitrophota bacterium]